MNSFRSEPFLWIHLAGLAVVPLSLLAVWLGLAAGDPVLPYGLEIAFLAIAGILPIAWMQWQRPFDIFSLLVLAVRPDRLTPQQCKILRLFKTVKTRIAAIAVAIFMIWAIWQIYTLAPLAAIATPLSGRWHLLGLLLAAIAFLFANLFLQVPISVVSVLLTSDSRFEEVEPYEVEKIGQDFLIFGIRIDNILAIASPEIATPGSTKEQSVNPPKDEISSNEEIPKESLETGENTQEENIEPENTIQDNKINPEQIDSLASEADNLGSVQQPQRKAMGIEGETLI